MKTPILHTLMMSILLVGLWNGDGWGSGRNEEYDQVSVVEKDLYNSDFNSNNEEEERKEPAADRHPLKERDNNPTPSAGGGAAASPEQKSANELGQKLIAVINRNKTNGEKLIEVNRLISAGANVNARDTSGNTPLICAAAKGYLETVKALLKHLHIDVNAQDNNGNTALMYAAGKGYLETVKALLKHLHINVNAQNNDGNTALMYAAQYSSDNEIINSLINNRANVNIENNIGMKAFMISEQKNKNKKIENIHEKEMMDIFAQDYNEKINSITRQEENAYETTQTLREGTLEDQLINAIKTAKVDTIKTLIKKGAKVNVTDNGTSLLHWAINNENPALVRLLINNGANVWEADIPNPPQTCLTCSNNRKQIYKMIQRKRALLKGLAETVILYHKSTQHPATNNPIIRPSWIVSGVVSGVSSVFGSKTPIKAFEDYLKAHLADDFVNNGHISLDLKKQNDDQQANHEQNDDEISTSSNEKQDVFKVVDDKTHIKLHPLDLVNRCYGNQHNKTILMVLAKYGHKDIVKWLFNQSKLPNRLLLNTIMQEDSIGERTAEDYAKRHQYGDIADMILGKKDELKKDIRKEEIKKTSSTDEDEDEVDSDSDNVPRKNTLDEIDFGDRELDNEERKSDEGPSADVRALNEESPFRDEDDF